MHELPFAIVTPWFGEDLKGGAEQHAWQIATRLSARGRRVEVLTTCCRSFAEDWEQNHFPQGSTDLAGITIRRFHVNPRNRLAFDTVNRELLAKSALLPGVSPLDKESEDTWVNENINSASLERYLHDCASKYQCFIFIPYLYGIVLRGLPLVAERAWLQACLHDEAYAYLPAVASIVSAAKRLLFLSQGEMELAYRLFGPGVIMKGHLVGAGVEIDRDFDSAKLPAAARDKRYVLCLGRRCKEKGTDDLVLAYLRFREKNPTSDLTLLLAGPGDQSYSDQANGIVDLGLVSEQEKLALIAQSTALCQPSRNESFSRVLYEAWHWFKPALVNRICQATCCAIDASGGGWTAESDDEWAELLARVDSASASELKSVGEKGARYARELADWNSVIDRYEQSFLLGAQIVHSVPNSLSVGAIHQLLPNLAPGDAISEQALWIQHQLRSRGYDSEILVLHADDRVRHLCKVYAPSSLRRDDGLIYHHSIGSETTSIAISHPGKKWLSYHNITPQQFFEPYDKPHALLLREGQEQMWSLARAFPHAVGDSNYNANDLRMYGFRSTGVLPIAVDPSKWAVAGEASIMKALQDGQRNLLYVGRFAPNKCQHDLVAAFAHYVEIDPDSRLILIGSGNSRDPYYKRVLEAITFYGLRDRVLLPGHVSENELNSYFRTASLYWSMSEHEGFCVPLVESMWFDVPVLAFRAGAIPETLDDAGVMFDDKQDLDFLASLAAKITSDRQFVRPLLKRQRERRRDFLPDAVMKQLFHALSYQ